MKSGKGKLFMSAALAMMLPLTTACYAHDGWIQSNAMRVVQGDMVYIDMQFGNHGNTHRDYKIYPSKWDITKATFKVHTPKGDTVDIADSVIDVGVDTINTFCSGATTYTDKNGYLVGSFQASDAGIYVADVRQDVVVSYAPERSVKCAKAIVNSVPSKMGDYAKSVRGFDKVVGQVFEIVPQSDPTKLKVGDTLTVQVLFKGEPLADAMVSVIPRGKVLPPMGEPNYYDLMTDMDGMASFTFSEANYHLIVAHNETSESGTLDGKNYNFTKYTADLTVIVAPAAKN